MSRQEQINYFIEKLRKNARKFDSLEKRRMNGEFNPENFEEFRKYEELRAALVKEWMDIEDEVAAAGLHEYFCEHVDEY